MNNVLAWVIFIVLDILSTGLGMGVPFFNIIFGLPVGWYLSRRYKVETQTPAVFLSSVTRAAVLTSAITAGLMLLIWSRMIPMLIGTDTELANFGIPMFLFEPRASFIGWIVLMILISPFLQFIMTLFGSWLGWQRLLQKK